MKNPIIAFAALLSLTFTLHLSAAEGQNWPSWRGANHDGASSETDLPTKWGPAKNIKWRIEMPGPGPSTPVVWQDHIFLTSAAGDDLVLMAIDTSGKQLWQRTVASGDRSIRSGESNMAAPSPSTDGQHVWAMFGTGELACFDFDGTPVWKIDLQKRYRKFSLYHGMSTSPLLDGDRLYLVLLHANTQTLVALDKLTGAEIWQHARGTDARSESRHAYTSPVIFRDGQEEILIAHGADYTTGHSLKDGSEIWRSGGLQGSMMYNPMFRLVATPVVAQGLVVIPSAKNGPVIALRPAGARGDITSSDPHIVWRRKKNTPDVPSPLLRDGLVYLCRENGQLLCLEAATGKEIYSERAHNRRHRGSPVYADGKIYLMGMDGTVTVVRAGRRFEVLARNRMDEQLAASLAISRGTIYLRTYEALYAIARKTRQN